MFAKLDKYGFAVTLVHILSCKGKEKYKLRDGSDNRRACALGQ